MANDKRRQLSSARTTKRFPSRCDAGASRRTQGDKGNLGHKREVHDPDPRREDSPGRCARDPRLRMGRPTEKKVIANLDPEDFQSMLDCFASTSVAQKKSM